MTGGRTGWEGLQRPFHFMVAFWGERYRDYFVELFLPSMLAPNNLPLLHRADGHRFYIATPQEDWAAIEGRPILQRLRRHVEPCWVPVSAPPAAMDGQDEQARYAAVLEHMKVCQRSALEKSYDPSAYGSFHFPDTLISDGLVALLLRAVRAGHQLVLCPALRQSEEAVLADIERSGLWSRDPRPSVNARELSLPPRLTASLAVRHLHPEMAIFEEGAKGQPPLPPFRYWRMPEGRGIVLHTFFIIPVLMDYSIVPRDHTACLDRDAIENVYVGENFRGCRRVHVISDSDDCVMLSLTPDRTDHSDPAPERPYSALRAHYERLCDIRRSFQFYALHHHDTVKAFLFRTPVRWHLNDIDETWIDAERRVERLIDAAIGDYVRQDPAANPQWHRAGRRNWRSFVLDLPLFDLPAITRGKIYQAATKLPPPLKRMVLRERAGKDAALAQED